MLASAPRQVPAANFARYAWAVVAINLLVVLWGVFVRASGSGAGCGSHWPLCNGEVIPQSPQIHTIIEFVHRVTSALAFFAVVGLVVWAFKRFPSQNRIRNFAVASAAFFIAEAALGAGLVLFDYVAANATLGRAFYLSMHLVNTELLLASVMLTAWLAQNPGTVFRMPAPTLLAMLIFALFVIATGGIAALGDTLFPASSLAQGLQQDLSASSNFLVRLRGLHPALAVLAAILFIFTAFRFIRTTARRIALTVLLLAMLQVIAGAINIALLAPTWMQIIHLLLADVLWLALVLLAVTAGNAQASLLALQEHR